MRLDDSAGDDVRDDSDGGGSGDLSAAATLASEERADVDSALLVSFGGSRAEPAALPPATSSTGSVAAVVIAGDGACGCTAGVLDALVSCAVSGWINPRSAAPIVRLPSTTNRVASLIRAAGIGEERHDTDEGSHAHRSREKR